MVRKRHLACVSFFERDARVLNVLLSMFDVGSREIDAAHMLDLAALHESNSERPGPAPDIENPLAFFGAGKIQKRFGKAPAPAAHQQLVRVTVSGCECRGVGHPYFLSSNASI